MLTRGMGYYADQEAVREAGKDWGIRDRDNNKSHCGETRLSPHHGLENGNYAVAGRNPRSVLNVSPEPLSLAHYAAFPPRLVEPLIKATCPRQACPVCGVGWAAVVERGERETHGINQVADLARAHEPLRANGTRHGTTSVFSTGTVSVSTVLAYRPTCEHVAAPVPGLVLDPFCGSGSTLIAARWLGLHAVGCDLSAPYLRDIARARLELDALDAWENGDGVQAETADLGPIFGVLR